MGSATRTRTRARARTAVTARTGVTAPNARQKLAARRAADRRASVRRRLLLAGGSTPFGHVYLQLPTAQQQAIFARYGRGSIPFVDVGNRYFLPQVQYLPSALAGLSWTQVATAMHDPASAVAKDIDGAANMITAAICILTKGQPGGVCHSGGVRAADSSI